MFGREMSVNYFTLQGVQALHSRPRTTASRVPKGRRGGVRGRVRPRRQKVHQDAARVQGHTYVCFLSILIQSKSLISLISTQVQLTSIQYELLIHAV